MNAYRAPPWAFVGVAILAAVQSSAGQSLCAPAPRQQPAPEAQTTKTQPSSPRRLTLQDALTLARKNSTQFQAALTNAELARQDRFQARAALLPTVTFDNSAIYTQAASPAAFAATQVPVVFIANNAVHEYISQANIHEAIDVAAIANFRKVSAAAAVAKAHSEIASRGLIVTVVQRYYVVAAAQQKLETAKRAAEEGNHFFEITQQLERGGEVAHADVIKSELQMRERQRQLQEAQLSILNARLDFAVLVFPDFNDNFELIDDLHAPVPMPTLPEVQQQAARDNPDLRAALAAVQESNHDVFAARAGYLPSVSLDYFYGIDAPQFAVNSTINGLKFSNLGSSIVGSLNLPVWNWGATQSRVRQAQLRRDQTKRELSFAQRKLLAEIRSLYAEAETSLNELEGLQRSGQLAEESLRLATLRYQNGESTVLEVVDAQTTFTTANPAYQDAAVRYRAALPNLPSLTGVLTTP